MELSPSQHTILGKLDPPVWINIHTQGVTGQLQVNGKLRHLRCCTLEDQSLDLKRKHRVAATDTFIMILPILT